MTVKRNGDFKLTPNEELHNNRVYKGSENPLSISRVYSADFECKFSMQFYPFDIQQCHMNFILEVKCSKIWESQHGESKCNITFSKRAHLEKTQSWLEVSFATMVALTYSNITSSVMTSLKMIWRMQIQMLIKFGLCKFKWNLGGEYLTKLSQNFFPLSSFV